MAHRCRLYLFLCPRCILLDTNMSTFLPVVMNLRDKQSIGGNQLRSQNLRDKRSIGGNQLRSQNPRSNVYNHSRPKTVQPGSGNSRSVKWKSNLLGRSCKKWYFRLYKSLGDMVCMIYQLLGRQNLTDS